MTSSNIPEQSELGTLYTAAPNVYHNPLTDSETLVQNLQSSKISNVNQFSDNNDINSPESKYYIFSKSFSIEKYTKSFEETLQKINASDIPPIAINPNNLPDVHSNYTTLEKNADSLKMITPNDIKVTFESMLEAFENFKVIYKTMKLNCLVCEKIKEYYQYQHYGINNIIKDANSALDQCEKMYQTTEREYTTLLETKNSSLKILDESINKLKRIELHPKMQSSDKKYLIDYYFEEDKINIWKNSCIEGTVRFETNLSEKNKLLLTERNNLLTEKSTTIIEIKSEWNLLTSDYDKMSKEFDSMQTFSFNELSNDFIQFKHTLTQIIDIFNSNSSPLTSNTELIDVLCKSIFDLKLKYNNINKDPFTHLQSLSEKLNDLTSKMKKSMEKLPIKINTLYLNLNGISRKLKELTDKLQKYISKMNTLKESFSSFKNPSYFPKAYQASVEEIKRRRIFNMLINRHFNYLQAMVSNENSSRKDFINLYGKYLPLKFFPNLKNTDIKISLEFNNENEFDSLPNLISNEEEEQILNLPLFKALDEITFSKMNNTFFDSIRRDRKMILNLLSEMEKSANTYQKLIDDFQSSIAEKDKCIKETRAECDNLSKRLNGKLNAKFDNCPMCFESAINSFEYQNWLNFSKDIQRKLADKEISYISLELKYQDLLKVVTQMKKTFFAHMNNVISQRNSEEKTKFKSLARSANDNSQNAQNYGEVEVQKWKKMIEEEKNKSEGLIANLRLVQSQLENKEADFRKLETMHNIVNNKLNVSNEKLLGVLGENQKLKSEYESIFAKSEEGKLKISQIENLLKISYNENNELKQSKDALMKEIEKLKEEILEKENEINNITIASNKQINNINNNNKEDNSIKVNDDILQIKSVEKGSMCIFVPHSEGVYVCINFSNDLNPNDEKEKNKFFKCGYILDLSSFDEEQRDLIVENSLIVFGTIGEISQYDPKSNISQCELPDEDTYYLVKLSKINYVIGFPGEELIFQNYNITTEEEI